MAKTSTDPTMRRRGRHALWVYLDAGDWQEVLRGVGCDGDPLREHGAEPRFLTRSCRFGG